MVIDFTEHRKIKTSNSKDKFLFKTSRINPQYLKCVLDAEVIASRMPAEFFSESEIVHDNIQYVMAEKILPSIQKHYSNELIGLIEIWHELYLSLFSKDLLYGCDFIEREMLLYKLADEINCRVRPLDVNYSQANEHPFMTNVLCYFLDEQPDYNEYKIFLNNLIHDFENAITQNNYDNITDYAVAIKNIPVIAGL